MNFDLEQLRNVFTAAKDKSIEYAGIAVDKTKDAAHLAKLKVNLASEKEAVKKSFTELGRTFYEENHATATGLFAQLCEEIDAANGRISALEDEIAALKAGVRKDTEGEAADFEDVVSKDEESDIEVEVTEEPEQPEAPEAPKSEE